MKASEEKKRIAAIKQQASPLYHEIRPAVEKVCAHFGLCPDGVLRIYPTSKEETVYMRHAIAYMLRNFYGQFLSYMDISTVFAYQEHSVARDSEIKAQWLIELKDRRFKSYLEKVQSVFAAHQIGVKPTCANCNHYEPDLLACCFRTLYELNKMADFVRTCAPDFSCVYHEIDKR